MSTYAIIHKQTEQVSPDDWEVRTYTLQVDESTTIGQIEKWVSDIHGGYAKDKAHSFQAVKLDKVNP